MNSPLLLMLSGVGPREVLEQAEIPVKVNIPAVGQNLNDHIWFMIQSFKFNASASPYIPRILEEDLEAAFTTYLETGEGVLGQVEAGPQAFHASSRAIVEGEPAWSDVRITLTTMCPLSFSDDVDSWTACYHMELDRMKSRGSVSLNTTAYLDGVRDVTKLVLIDFKAFDVASDLDVALDGIDLVFRIMEETSAFQSLGTTFAGTAINGCTHLPFRSREYWACHVQQVATTAIHSVGTCSMGAVTDSKLRVMGVPGLRVVDASVLPYTPNANINGPVILVAEKAADEISQQWGGLSQP
ncbi:choline dehydrogenase, mitochondrial [Folsomia candida]|nr:choline dehydrogenase, mitochondrial [Folsomia candida]